ncbi:enoyl-CoA hydratase/isomerase family protein [Aureibacter tunicatorum]|uniref:Enoyl-CoA hydratase n=1 Tax=Aureibacter tunicatorum TaxID=866807 RepID=A0AAE3XIZ5_9BACT|nr:enoyl-CoA hydratase-related protein [Aureibacter tunicatorum]MDR6237722.1 enoyl-CoA hydratase [Aureibacter tunicatorum]BDD02757.1 enoyl-CoA hydratase [Aureibacter tunicatorum]
MADFEYLKVSQQNHILTITLSRKDKLNAINTPMIEELQQVIQEVYDLDEVKGVIIRGDGDKAFVVGADIKEISQLNELNGRKYSETGQELFSLIENCHKPVIAAITGYCLGGGLELAMACHLRIATEEAKFGMPEANVGMIPGFGGTQRLPKLVGKGKALELLMTCDQISATEAKAIGLLNTVVSDDDELTFKCNSLLEKITSKAPLAIGMVINCVNAADGNSETGFQTESNNFSNCFKSQDFKEGIEAFVEKREPNFIGE